MSALSIDVVVGDDVALGIDDEAGAERLAAPAAVVAAVLVGHLAAEEAVEEVLEVVLALTLAVVLIVVLIVVAGILRIGLHAAVEVARGRGSPTAWAASGY